MTLSDKACCWMHKVVLLPNPAQFCSSAWTGLCTWHFCGSGCAGAASVGLLVPKTHRYSAC